MSKRRQLGRYGEQQAEQYLLRKGYTLLARNWRCPVGELDLVMQQGQVLVFVEVRTRRGQRLGTAEESITPAKQAKLVELAYTYLAEHVPEEVSWRIDVVAINLDGQGRIERLNHLEAAVGAPE